MPQTLQVIQRSNLILVHPLLTHTTFPTNIDVWELDTTFDDDIPFSTIVSLIKISILGTVVNLLMLQIH